MAKEDPKNASQHKNHVAQLATKIDDLITKLEAIEKSKKQIKKTSLKQTLSKTKLIAFKQR